MTSEDASRLMREAHALKAAGRLEEAVVRYGEALSASSGSGVAEYSLAEALGDAGRWEEAEPHIRAAIAKGVDTAEAWLLLARCEQALLRLDASTDAFRQAIHRQPAMPDAHRELAQLSWMRFGDLEGALSGIEAALSTSGSSPLAMVKAQTLELAGHSREAFTVMADLAAANPQQVSIVVYAAQLATGLGLAQEAIALADRAAVIAPHEMSVQVTRAEAFLAAGQPDRASDIAGALRRRWSTNQHAMALQATAWRMLGDPRYRQLYDYDAFVWSSLLDTPNGWADLQAYLSDLTSALDALHSDREHSFDQSLRHGRQTVDLLRQPHPALRALPEALDGPIRKRLTELGRGEDPVRSRNSGEYAPQGMRSVKVHPGGDYTDQVHAHGWLSSTCHVGTVSPKRKEGWIKFGQPGIKTLPSLEPEHFVEPKPGLLVLFPSYMWHGAEPFTDETSRLTFAFDLVPRPDTSEDK